MNHYNHTSYIFAPFVFEKKEDFPKLISKLDKSKVWTQVQDEIKYMLKYVADKIDSTNRQKCQCFHYELCNTARAGFGLPEQDCQFPARPADKDEEETFFMRLLGVHLYCFSTTVCILAFRICLSDTDPLQVASALYYLKKVSRIELLAPDAKPRTLLDLVKALTSELSSVSKLDFFYYVNPSTERANTLTYLEFKQKGDYRREMFYLRNNYHRRFSYVADEELDSKENFSAISDKMWGVTPEAAVCLATLTDNTENYLHARFFVNFNIQYLFMYVLLLHQKYVLYMFLTKLSARKSSDLEALENYRQELCEYEANFVFSCITEVPQYQYLYERMTQAFSLKKMYDDVHEPLLALSEIRSENLENQQQKRNQLLSRALFALSLLSLFSALVDSFEFVGAFFGSMLDDIWVTVIQVLCVALILGVFFYVLRVFIKDRNK